MWALVLWFGFWSRYAVVFGPNMRSCKEVVAVFRCLEAAFLLIVRQAGEVCEACLTLGLLPTVFGTRFRLTTSHVE